MITFSVLDLLELDLKEHNALNLKCVAGRRGLVRRIPLPNINRPGLALSGFFDNFAEDRIQIFGRGEHSYLKKLETENNESTILRFFEFAIPCCIFTHNLDPLPAFIAASEKAGCPILLTDLDSSEFNMRLLRALSDVFSPRQTVHGVFVEVFGIGVLIQGGSGVGKSESALELIERGHRLIADDAVELSCVSGNILIGEGASKAVGHHMEIRGIGILNISHLFGVGAIRDKKRVQFVVKLEEWDPKKTYDRLGAKEELVEFLGVKVPCITIPIRPGRNVPILIETAAMNERLKKMGFFSAREFNKGVMRWLESENAKTVYWDKTDDI